MIPHRLWCRPRRLALLVLAIEYVAASGSAPFIYTDSDLRDLAAGEDLITIVALPGHSGVAGFVPPHGEIQDHSWDRF